MTLVSGKLSKKQVSIEICFVFKCHNGSPVFRSPDNSNSRLFRDFFLVIFLNGLKQLNSIPFNSKPP